MSETIEDLVVRAKPEGLSETSSGFTQMQDDLKDTESQMQDTTGGLEELNSKWSGAMSAMVGGLAVASAGLLSQVPVVGEAFGALGTVVDAIAFKMDSTLRPVLQPLTGFFYSLSEGIYESEGALGALIGVGGTIAAVLGVIAGAVVSAVGGFIALGGSWATVAAIGSTVISVVGSVISAIISLVSLPALVIGAILAIATALIFNIGGARDTVGRIIKDILGFFGDLATKGASKVEALWTDAKTWLSNFSEDGVQYIEDLWSGAKEWFGELVSEAQTAGEDVYEKFLGALKGIGQAIAGVFVGAVNGIIDALNAALDKVPDSVKSQFGISGLDNVSLGDVGVSASSDSGGSADSPGFRARRSGSEDTYLNGRDLSEETGRYRSDAVSRRGRHG